MEEQGGGRLRAIPHKRRVQPEKGVQTSANNACDRCGGELPGADVLKVMAAMVKKGVPMRTARTAAEVAVDALRG
jgi:hypothetical protein